MDKLKKNILVFIESLKTRKPNWSCEQMLEYFDLYFTLDGEAQASIIGSTGYGAKDFILYLKTRKPNWSCEHMEMVIDDYIEILVREENKVKAKTNLTVNIFIKRPGFYNAIITTLDDLQEGTYDRKHTLRLYEAMDWKDGTCVGAGGSAKIHNLSKYNNDHFYYANTIWDYMHKDNPNLYRAISKDYVSEALQEIDLDRGMFLFTKPIS